MPRTSTIAEALKPLGYATGQFGKNHLGDKNEFLPTVHGFDEFFGNLYHLNAEEEPEHPDYPKDPRFRERFGPRGVLRCRATDSDDPTVDPRFGRVGKQTIEDTGPLTKKRMETIDDETVGRRHRLHQAAGAGQHGRSSAGSTRRACTPSRMCGRRCSGQSGISEYFDGMIEHDGQVGQILKALDDLGIANDTIVVYSTDNGPHMNTWPDGGYTPFRNEKNSNWEGAFRVPAFVRWPGRIPAGKRVERNLLRARLVPDAAGGGRRYRREGASAQRLAAAGRRAHLQAASRRLQPASHTSPDSSRNSARKEFFYFNDDGQLVAMRYENMKLVFCEQREAGTLADLARAVHLPARAENVQPAHGSLRAGRYHLEHLQRLDASELSFLVVPAQAIVAQFIGTFKEFPPRQNAVELQRRSDHGDDAARRPQGG